MKFLAYGPTDSFVVSLSHLPLNETQAGFHAHFISLSHEVQRDFRAEGTLPGEKALRGLQSRHSVEREMLFIAERPLLRP